MEKEEGVGREEEMCVVGRVVVVGDVMWCIEEVRLVQRQQSKNNELKRK